ncbi:hypothetical protein AXF42_Ash001208 [Apostasia shenzhenica]|uniref:Uncharacterized protein n=1 Tax=Apostasia shenzhenica TaxID=1088818 RepID=A0A2I0AU98_9ASPA|nr:hypothetical protein AXF42_Ash001208 [Apostasia shenzhenica]
MFGLAPLRSRSESVPPAQIRSKITSSLNSECEIANSQYPPFRPSLSSPFIEEEDGVEVCRSNARSWLTCRIKRGISLDVVTWTRLGSTKKAPSPSARRKGRRHLRFGKVRAASM